MRKTNVHTMGPNMCNNSYKFQAQRKRNLFSQHVCNKLHHAKNTCLKREETFYRYLTLITGGEIDRKRQFGQAEKSFSSYFLSSSQHVARDGGYYFSKVTYYILIITQCKEMCYSYVLVSDKKYLSNILLITLNAH